MHHFWNAPATVTAVPGPTTVVVRSNCGQTMNMPAWQVLEWQNQHNPIPNRVDTCPACVAAVQSD